MSSKKKPRAKKKPAMPDIPFDPKAVPEQVLLYGLDEDTARGERLRKVLNEIDLPFRDLTEADLSQKVGYLAGLEGMKPLKGVPQPPAPETELLLMCGVSEETMDRLFPALRAEGLDIGHKASLTEHNRKWTLAALLTEVAGEHTLVQAYMALNRLANASMGIIQEAGADTPDIIALRNGVAEAVRVMSQDEPSEQELRETADLLKERYFTVSGLQELTGQAVLDVQKEEGETYRLAVVLRDAPEGLDYEYRWNSGETGPVLEHIRREDLIRKVVTVRSPQGYGTLTAQLQVPKRPLVSVRKELDRLKIRWDRPAQAVNRPKVEHYCLEVFRDEYSHVGSMRFHEDANSAELDDLEEDSVYTLKVWAENVAGRSDKAVVRCPIEGEG